MGGVGVNGEEGVTCVVEVKEEAKVGGVGGAWPNESEDEEPKLNDEDEPEGLKENAGAEETAGAPAGL